MQGKSLAGLWWTLFLAAAGAFLIVGSLAATLTTPHPQARRDLIYVRSVAVVWALDSIEDDVSCHDSLEKYEDDFEGLPREVRSEIATTYEDLMGACSDNDPPAEAREVAESYLRGMHVQR